jgi:FixJ family two-component response regulator
VVEDDELMVKGLQYLLGSVNLTMVAYKSAQSLLDAYDPSQAGCAIVDIRLNGMSGLDLYRAMMARQIQLPVIFVTGYGDVSMAVRALQEGAFDFIEKPWNDQHLLDRVHAAIALNLKARIASNEKASAQKLREALTLRESQVLSLVVDGLSNKEISEQLSLSVKTIEAHRASMMEKLQVGSLVDLIKQYAH